MKAESKGRLVGMQEEQLRQTSGKQKERMHKRDTIPILGSTPMYACLAFDAFSLASMFSLF